MSVKSEELEETKQKSVAGAVLRDFNDFAVGTVMSCHAFTAEGVLLLAKGEIIISQDQIDRLRRPDVIFSHRPPKNHARLLWERHRRVGGQVLENAAGRDSGAAPAASIIATTSFREEIAAARAVRRSAIRVMENLIEESQTGVPLQLGAAHSVVREMLDSLDRNERALTSLIRLNSIDSYTFTHSVNTCILTIILAGQCISDRKELEALGLGALLHDIGKVWLPMDVLRKHRGLTRDEWELMKKHPLFGAEIVRASQAPERCNIDAVAQHHERLDGSGYPHHLSGSAYTMAGRIVALADVFDALTSDRPYRKRVSPPDAMRWIAEGAGALYDPFLTRLFVSHVGVFPIGSLVRLNTGELSIVVKVNPNAIRRPAVFVISDAGGEMGREPRLVDLATFRDEKNSLEIVEMEDPLNFKVDIDDYLGLSPEPRSADLTRFDSRA